MPYRLGADKESLGAEGVQLELTDEEAAALLALLSRRLGRGTFGTQRVSRRGKLADGA